MRNKSIKNLIKIPLYIFALLITGLLFSSTVEAASPRIIIASSTGLIGSTLVVPVTAENLSSVIGGLSSIDFTVNYDSNLLSYSTTTIGPNYSRQLSNIVITPSPSKASFSWIDDTPSFSNLLHTDGVIFSMSFIVNSNISTSSRIFFSGAKELSDGNTNIVSTPDFINSNLTLNPAPIGNAPSMPNMLNAIAGNGNALVLFTPPANNGGSRIMGYTVTSSPDNITTVREISPVTITGLTNGKLYTFTVTATNVDGRTSSSSVESNVVRPTNAQSVVSAPKNISAIAGDGKVTLSWTPPATIDELPYGVTQTSSIFKTILAVFVKPQSSTISDYAIEYKPKGSTENWVRYNDGVNTNTSATIANLSNGVEYSFVVSAESNGKVGVPSNVVSIAPNGPSANKPIVQISANPTNISNGLPSNISWSSTNAVSCNIVKNNSTITWQTGLNGLNISTGPLTATTTFTLTCTGVTNLTTSGEVIVNVHNISNGGGGSIKVAPMMDSDEVPVLMPGSPTAPVVVPVAPEMPAKIAPPSQEVSNRTSKISLSATIFNVIKRFFGI